MRKIVTNEQIHSCAKALGMDTVACTAGELIKLLQKVPPDTEVWGTGADIGGYDISYQGYVYLDSNEQAGKIVLNHLECIAWSTDSVNNRPLIDSLEFED